RRSCPPNPQLILCHDVADPLAELLNVVPLARPRPGGQLADPPAPDGTKDVGDTVPVRFTSDRPFSADFPSSSYDGVPVTTLNDEPVRLLPRDRVYRSRQSFARTVNLPAALCKGYGLDYLEALDAYVNPSAPERTTS
ncbi:type I-E CRISPR-associated protein Cas5/CasD, partial [Streptomyces xiamenensis]